MIVSSFIIIPLSKIIEIKLSDADKKKTTIGIDTSNI